MKKTNSKKNASATLYIIFFFIMFLAFSAFAVDGTIVLTNRLKLQNSTEAAALAAASEFNSTTSVSTKATDMFNTLKSDSLSNAKVVSVKVDADKNQVLLSTEYISQPIFLAFLGVTGIKLEAKACATSEPLPVEVEYDGVNWINSSMNEYYSDILATDSSILKPLGEYVKSAAMDSLVASNVDFRLITSVGLPLGAGGYITVKLPAPIIDKPGDDLYVEENGYALEGYMVFAGLDVNPENPYVSSATQGNGIYWLNISSSGTSADNLSSPVSSVATSGLGLQDKFYGSGNFDISKCGLSMVKYIRIVDDNEEKAFVKGNSTLYNFLGEASSATGGADIANIKVLNHVRLMSPSKYGV